MDAITADVMLDNCSEQDEIKAVIQGETAAFLKQDVDAQCAFWVQEPYLQHTTILPYCGVVQVTGITGLRAHFEAHFEYEKALKIKSEGITQKNWSFVIRDNMAWVTFEQFSSSSDAAHMYGLQMHTRILEKVCGRWKLISSTGVLSRLDFYDCPKIHVDGSGMVLQASEHSKAVVAAHPVLDTAAGRLTAKKRKNAKVLHDAIRKAQNGIEIGIAHLPVPLLFEGDPGADGSLSWIAVLDMKIVVLLDDAGLVETAIQNAGKIYSLSATQLRVAEEIARGKDLTTIAETLDISIHTVRTHVKRMFERVGVNNQKALLKRLLSAQAPAVGLHY